MTIAALVHPGERAPSSAATSRSQALLAPAAAGSAICNFEVLPPAESVGPDWQSPIRTGLQRCWAWQLLGASAGEALGLLWILISWPNALAGGIRRATTAFAAWLPPLLHALAGAVAVKSESCRSLIRPSAILEKAGAEGCAWASC